MFLWEAWQKHVSPPPAPPAKPRARRNARRPASRSNRPTSRRVPRPAPAPPGGAGAPGAPPGRPAPPVAPQGEQVTVKTDLYHREIDTRRRRDQRRSRSPSIATRPTRRSRTSCSSARRAHVRSRRRGCSAKGCRTTARATGCCPGRASSRPAQDKLDVKLASDRAERRQGRADADVPSRQLRDRRRVRRHERGRARRITPYAYFQLTRDTKHAVPQSSMAPVAVRRPGRLQRRPTSSRRSTSPRSTSSPPTRRASRRSRRRPTTAGSA